MLEKRGRSPYWQIRFTLRGVTVQKSSGTTDRKKAEALEEKFRRQIWDSAHGEVGVGWAEGVAEWQARKGHKRSLKRDMQILDMASEVWAGRNLADITEDEISEYCQSVMGATSSGNAARHMAMLRSFFNAMYRWKKIRLPLRVDIPRTEQYEPMTMTREQADKIMSCLPAHLVPLVTFALETGMRFSNVARLRWEAPGAHVDLAQRTITVPASSAKAKKPITVPLSTAAMECLQKLERSGTGYVFVDHRGRAPMKSIKTGWRVATTKAGLRGLRVHDLRHTWATWHAKAGTPSRILQDLGGWSSQQMVRRYTHLNVADLRQFVK